jgi:hypothetical protein
MDAEVIEPQETVSTDKLIEAYVKIRDIRTEAKQEFESKDEEFAKQLKVLELELLDICKAQGADSIKTRAGTAIRSIKSKYWTGDWDSMYNFIRENDAFLLLEKRLHQTNMRQFLDENPDLKPAGLNIDSEYAVTVRRSKN